MAFSSTFLRKFSRILTKKTQLNTTGVRLCTTNAVGSTVGGIFNQWLKKFRENSISEPKESIEHILTHCLGRKRVSDVYKLENEVLSEEKVFEIEGLCRKRLEKIPVQYVIGEWAFRNLVLKMSPPVFIPRPETEELVGIVLVEIASGEVNDILDLCCGSGAITLSLLQENPTVKVVAVDQSKRACDLTLANAINNKLDHRLKVLNCDVGGLEFEEKFDVIVSNPPYVYSEDLANLQPEIKMYEDLKALNGGEDGLKVIKTILRKSSHCLRENGKLFLEVEPRHPNLLHQLLIKNSALGLAYCETFKDFSGKERFVKIIKL